MPHPTTTLNCYSAQEVLHAALDRDCSSPCSSHLTKTTELSGPLHPLNALIGGNVTVFKRWEAFAEYGFNGNDVPIVAAGLSFRF
jgi:hypothetical protein